MIREFARRARAVVVEVVLALGSADERLAHAELEVPEHVWIREDVLRSERRDHVASAHHRAGVVRARDQRNLLEPCERRPSDDTEAENDLGVDCFNLLEEAGSAGLARVVD